MEFEVKGMTCGGCSAGVDRALRKLDGVRDCAVDHEAGRARVDFDVARVTAARIVERIEAMGYEARALE